MGDNPIDIIIGGGGGAGTCLRRRPVLIDSGRALSGVSAALGARRRMLVILGETEGHGTEAGLHGTARLNRLHNWQRCLCRRPDKTRNGILIPAPVYAGSCVPGRLTCAGQTGLEAAAFLRTLLHGPLHGSTLRACLLQRSDASAMTV